MGYLESCEDDIATMRAGGELDCLLVPIEEALEQADTDIAALRAALRGMQRCFPAHEDSSDEELEAIFIAQKALGEPAPGVGDDVQS